MKNLHKEAEDSIQKQRTMISSMMELNRRCLALIAKSKKATPKVTGVRINISLN